MEARILNGEAPCGQERETNVCSVTGKSSEAGCGEKGGRIGQTCPQVFYEPLSATLQDFDWWSGLPVADARNALEMIKPDLVSEKIKNKAANGRLEYSGPFGSMCSHRVQIVSVKEVDSELLAWLKEAYEGAK